MAFFDFDQKIVLFNSIVLDQHSTSINSTVMVHDACIKCSSATAIQEEGSLGSSKPDIGGLNKSYCMV